MTLSTTSSCQPTAKKIGSRSVSPAQNQRQSSVTRKNLLNREKIFYKKISKEIKEVLGDDGTFEYSQLEQILLKLDLINEKTSPKVQNLVNKAWTLVWEGRDIATKIAIEVFLMSILKVNISQIQRVYEDKLAVSEHKQLKKEYVMRLRIQFSTFVVNRLNRLSENHRVNKETESKVIDENEVCPALSTTEDTQERNSSDGSP